MSSDNARHQGSAHEIPSFAERLRHLRKAAGFSQQQLARAAGISQSSLAGYERGRSEPKYAALASLATALGLTVQDLNSIPIGGAERKSTPINFNRQPTPLTWVDSYEYSDQFRSFSVELHQIFKMVHDTVTFADIARFWWSLVLHYPSEFPMEKRVEAVLKQATWQFRDIVQYDRRTDTSIRTTLAEQRLRIAELEAQLETPQPGKAIKD